MKTQYTHRIRRCKGNKDAWLLVALDDNGNELESYVSYKTGLTIDSLLATSGGLLPTDEDVVQIVYFTKDDEK